MSGILLLLSSTACFVAAYFIYGRYLCRLFGVDSERSTPAHTHRDGVDYVPTKSPVLFGHHFASIAGAGPIVGPIAAIYFGWLPVVLWIVIGCIFVGAVHDFAAMFLSVRKEGRSIGHIIEEYIGYAGRQIFLLFCWAALILVVAVFARLVASTFVSNPAAATASLLFIAMAPVFGWLVYRKGVSLVTASLIFVPLLFAFIAVGTRFPCDLMKLLDLGKDAAFSAWMYILFLYVFSASVAPVWILLQPRDYLNSYLLYAMMVLGFGGILMAAPQLEFPVFEGWTVLQRGAPSSLVPILFVTVACGACSGFHALVASGTSSKQIDNEKHILPIAYGGMLLEGVLAIMAVISVAYLSRQAGAEAMAAGGGPVGAFAGGLSTFCLRLGVPGALGRNFFTLAISAFLLTTLDTATRLTRFIWQELFLPRGAWQETPRGGVYRIFSNRYVATLIVVAMAGFLALSGESDVIWPVFGASNQLLAALTLLVITLILIRRKSNFWITLFPMLFMMTICTWALVELFISNMGRNRVMVVATAFLLAMAVMLVFQSIGSLRKAGASKEGK